jgi:hypothetical protein
MNTHIITQRIDWNGITIEVSWEPSWLSVPELRYNVSHLQVSSIAPARAALPISETGYRSLFIDPASVRDEGGPLAFVRAWLDNEANSPSWRLQEAEAKQYALF